MKKFLSTTKGKIIAGAATLAVIAAVIVIIIIANQGYRSIIVDDLNGTTTVTSGVSSAEAFKGQNLVSGNKVAVRESSDLTLALDTDKHVFARENTKFRLEALGAAGKDSKTTIYLEEGSVLSEISAPLGEDESYVVDTPNASMAVRGTTFEVTVFYDENGECHTTVSVEEGKVRVTKKDEDGDLTNEHETLSAGETTEVIGELEAAEKPVQSSAESSGNGGNSTPANEPLPDLPETITLAGQEFEIDVKNRYLFIRDTDLSNEDIQEISKLKGLERLHLQKCNPSDISPLASLTNLQSLAIHYSQITDISPLANLTNLSSLSLCYGEISDISPLANLINLKHLNLNMNQITDISSLANLTNLTGLTLSYNQISDISPLVKLTKMTGLDLNYNQISDISPLANMVNLERLSAIDNKFTDFSVLYNMKKLKDVSIISDGYISYEEQNALKSALGIG